MVAFVRQLNPQPGEAVIHHNRKGDEQICEGNFHRSREAGNRPRDQRAGGLVRRSWREVNEIAAGMAAALMDLGVGQGDRVVVLAGEPSEIAPLIEAIWTRDPRARI